MHWRTGKREMRVARREAGSRPNRPMGIPCAMPATQCTSACSSWLSFVPLWAKRNGSMQAFKSRRVALQMAVSTDHLGGRGLKECGHGKIITQCGRTMFEVGFV